MIMAHIAHNPQYKEALWEIIQSFHVFRLVAWLHVIHLLHCQQQHCAVVALLYYNWLKETHLLTMTILIIATMHQRREQLGKISRQPPRTKTGYKATNKTRWRDDRCNNQARSLLLLSMTSQSHPLLSLKKFSLLFQRTMQITNKCTQSHLLLQRIWHTLHNQQTTFSSFWSSALSAEYSWSSFNT